MKKKVFWLSLTTAGYTAARIPLNRKIRKTQLRNNLRREVLAWAVGIQELPKNIENFINTELKKWEKKFLVEEYPKVLASFGIPEKTVNAHA